MSTPLLASRFFCYYRIMTKTMKRLNLALQGGGAHGAYTWGVLDRILEEDDIEVAGISGTSAGAMNAVVMVNGYMENGRDGAKKSLECFWQSISNLGNIYSPFQQTPLEETFSPWNLDWSLAYNWFELMTRFYSPYEFNPLNLNPLRDTLTKHLNIESIQACSLMRVFIAATHVESGQARIFQCDEITVDAVLASACIPFIFQAVEIDGAPYWDGGYMGNPVLWPLFYKTPVQDILLIQLNPLFREGTPKRAPDIINRLNEINFNSSLISEMRAIHFVSKLIKEKRLDPEEYKDIHMHLIGMPDVLANVDASSKMNTRWAFFEYLKELGRTRAEIWLKENKKHLGIKSSIDIEDEFLKPHTHKRRNREAA